MATIWEQRDRLIAQLMVGWPRTPTGRLRAGFWALAMRELERVEGPGRLPYHHDLLQTTWNARRKRERARLTV